MRFLFVVDVFIQHTLFKVYDHIGRRVSDHVQGDHGHTGQIASTREYPIIHSSEFIPRPDMTTYTMVVPATGIAGVPTAVQMDRKAAVARVAGVTLIPAAVAIKLTAIMCMAVVPFMLMVIPVGRTKLLISSEQPSSSVHVLVFSGSVAADELVAAANNPILKDFFKNGIGFSRVVRKIPIG